MELRFKEFNGLTFGMDSANTKAIKAIKKNAVYREIVPFRRYFKQKCLCVPAKYVAAAMGGAAWLVLEEHSMATVQIGDEPTEYQIIYDDIKQTKGTEKMESNEQTEARIAYLRVAEIYPHPKNPRKDLGDLSELADSIKAQGVLQNLTVVRGHVMTEDEHKKLYGKYNANPSEDIRAQLNQYATGRPPRLEAGYTVVIGHRRLAAAKLAGLDTIPCIVTDMPEAEQVTTMLIENMQRTDLTVYEQAQGFQMMMDLGESVNTLADKSGFSQTTIRRRLKLLELDPKKFKESEQRGATMADYAKLEKINDPKLKNKVLETIGTNNFQNVLYAAVKKEQEDLTMKEIENFLKTFARKIEKKGEGDIPMIWAAQYANWSKVPEEKPKDADSVRYFYVKERGGSLTLYKEKVRSDADDAELRRKEEHERRHKRRLAAADAVAERHRKLRYDFVKNVSEAQARKHIDDICRFALFAEITARPYDYKKYIAEYFKVDLAPYEEMGYWKKDKLINDALLNATAQSPIRGLLGAFVAFVDKGFSAYFSDKWNGSKQEYEIKHTENEELTRVYELLTSLGYRMSDEEKQMQDGTHEIFEEVQEEGAI